MKTSLHRPLLLLLSLALSSLLAGCAPEPSPVLRIGLNPWPGYEFMFLAQEKGYYRDEGLTVRLIEFSSLSDCRRAYERGQIDGMGTTVIDVLTTRDQSKRSPQIVQICDYSNGADVILTQPAITNAAGLRGARIGVELASLGIFVLGRGLEKNGLSLDAVKVVGSDQLSMEDLFRKGELDAIVTYPPTSVNLLRDTKARVVFSTAEIPGEVVDGLAIEEAVARQRPGDIAKFLHAYHRAVAYWQANPDDAHRIMAAREGLTPAEFAAALNDGIKVLGAADQAAYLQPGGRLATVIDASDRILRREGQLKGADRRAGMVNPNFLSR